MTTRPDIIVSGEYDSDWQLIVEVKARGGDREVEEQLRHYLHGHNCPVGLLVTNEDLRFFRETYATSGPDSIARVAVHPLPDDLKSQSVNAVAFERAVQGWLERLALCGTVNIADLRLAATLDEHVLPILREGRIRAGRPRWVREARAR